jgi:glycosyltransferase involved in cell wall biosynthesis
MNMKILLFGSKEYPFGISQRFDRKAGGGIEVHVEKLAKYLSKNGHDVYIITRRFPGQKKEEHTGKIHIYRVRFLYNRYLRTFSFNKLSFLKALNIIKREKIEVIHSHGMVASYFASFLSKLTKKPLVMTPHGTIDEWGIFKLPLKIFEKISLRTAKKVLFISRFAQKRMSPGSRSHALLTNAIDFDEIQKPRERSWEKVRFGFIGRLEEVKGILTAIESFKALPQDRCEFYIAGEGPLKEKVLESIGGYKNIKFLGWVKPNSFFQQIDAFVLPSKERGQPFSILEAMAYGKIIITSLAHHLIENNKTGILTKPDTESLFKDMLYVLNNFKKCSQLGKNSQRSAKNLDWATVIKGFIKEYQSVIKHI